MRMITRDTDYAIRALCCIARSRERIVSVRDLTSSLKIPRPFLRKILQKLNKAKILRSYKGIGGGFALAESAENISVMDLIEAFQGPFSITEHTFKSKACPHTKKCKLKKKLDRIEKGVADELRSISLASLLK